MERRAFVKQVLALTAYLRQPLAAWPAGSRAPISAPAAPLPRSFPVIAQLSPPPGRPDWNTLAAARDRLRAARAAVDAIAGHGFTTIECPLHVPPEESQAILDYIRSRGLRVAYDRTFAGGGVEIIGREKPPPMSVFSARYQDALRRNIEAAVAEAKPFGPADYVFFYQDEPFHAGPGSFDTSEETRQEFRRRYGYDLPVDLDAARARPRVWQDLIDFRSSEFPAAWRQAYRIIKEIDPAANVILTHDSHSTFGAGVGSNAKMAIDDVFHWGGDFADTFLFDIYPYMMFDFRYGDAGVLREPRLSQMHYALGQMRNLAYANGKQFGFWFGTFNQRWFRKFMSPALRARYWTERETSLTAVAHGANLLVSGYNMPADARHWASLGDGLRLIQRAGPALRAAPMKRAKACFLFPRTQYIQLQEEYWNVGISYELFSRAFGELDVLHEDQITDDRLGGYRILALFDVRLLPEVVAQRIERFVRAGGIVVADCVPNLDGLANPSDVMGRLFGVRDAVTARVERSGVWVPEIEKPHWFVPPRAGDADPAPVRDRVRGTAFGRAFDFAIASPRPCTVTEGETLVGTVAGHAAVVRRSVGRGRAYLLGFCVQDSSLETYRDGDEPSRDQLLAMVRCLTEDAGVRAHVSSSSAQIEATLRSTRDAGFLFVINHGATAAATTVRLADLDFDPARMVDLANGRAVRFERHDDGVASELRVSPDTPRLIRLDPRPVPQTNTRRSIA